MPTIPIGMQSLDAAGAIVSPATAEGQQRHELHAAAQPVVTVTTTAGGIETLLGGAVPSWVTACRLYVGSGGRIAYSTDATPPAFAAGDVTHGAPLDNYYPGHLVTGNVNVAAIQLIAETGDTVVTVELIG